MNRIVAYLCIGLVLLGGAAFGYRDMMTEPSPPAPSLTEQVADSFRGFNVGEKKAVDIDLGLTEADIEFDIDAFLSQREDQATPALLKLRSGEARLEQIRDLLLRAAVSAYDGNAEVVAGALHDANPLRKAYLNTTTSSQYGRTRFAALDEGLAVALLPADLDANVRHDALANIADRLVTETGDRPRALAVFEYCFNDPKQALASQAEGAGGAFLDYDRDGVSSLPVFATLEMVEPIQGTTLFSNTFGYVQRQVETREDVAAFLAAADDLVGVEPAYTGSKRVLVLSGRKYRARSYEQVTPEHISTLVHAFTEIRTAEQRYEEQFNALVTGLAKQETRARIAAAVANKDVDPSLLQAFDLWSTSDQSWSVPAGLSEEFSSLVKDDQDYVLKVFEDLQGVYGTCKWEFIGYNIAEAKAGRGGSAQPNALFVTAYEQFSALRDGLTPEEASLLRGGVGFSLDTDYDFEVLRDTFRQFMATDRTGVARVVKPFEPYIQQQLAEGKAQFLLCALQQFEHDNVDEIFRQVSHVLQDPARYQIARYDGGIFGTEVGQILFLTDLMAKLLDMDFNGLFAGYFPDGSGGWTPSAYNNPPVHYIAQLDKVPGTRIWFGLRHGAHIEDGDAIRFAPVATRVFALSHGTLREDRETQPGFLAERFVGWFNNNYDQVAAVEPRYDQLNQIIKWSLALDTLGDVNWSFPYLGAAPVRRDLWFPQWSLAGGERGAERWANCFHERGRYGHEVETLPVFHMGWPDAPGAWCGGTDPQDSPRYWSFNGGVSLPRANAAAKLRVDSAELGVAQASARRGPILKNSIKVGDDGLSYSRVPQYNQRQSIAMGKLDELGVIRTRRSVESVKKDELGAFVPDDKPVFNRGEILEANARTSEEVTDFSMLKTGRIRSDVRVEGAEVGQMEVGRVVVDVDAVSGRIALEPATLLKAENVANRFSRVDPAKWRIEALQEPNVRAVYADGDAVYIRFADDAGEWVRLEAQAAPDPFLKKTVLARASDLRTELDLLLDVEPKPVLITKATPEEVAGKVSDINGMTVVRVPREDGSFSIDIRGPPQGPPRYPPSRNAAAGAEDPGRREIRLLVARDNDGSVNIGAPRRSKAPDGDELEAALLKVSNDGVWEEQAVLRVPYHNEDNIKVASLYRQREDAFTTPMHEPAAVNRLLADREARFKAAVQALEEGNDTLSRQLVDDIGRDFGSLFPAERQQIAALRLQLAHQRHPGLPPTLREDLVTLIRNSGKPETIGRKAREDLMRMYDRGGAVRAERAYADYRAFMMDLAESGQRGGPRYVADGEAVHARWACNTSRVDPADVSFDKTLAYVDTRIPIDADFAPWPPTVPDVVYLKVASSAEASARSLARNRPDLVWLGDAARFRLPTATQAPSLQEAAASPEAADHLERYLSDLAATATRTPGSASACTAEELAAGLPCGVEEVVFMARKEDIAGSCSARGLDLAMAQLSPQPQVKQTSE